MTTALRPSSFPPLPGKEEEKDDTRLRILIVDDHEIIRHGVRSLLEGRPHYEICGEAIDGNDAINKARELKPDLIIMDVSMPTLNGLEATRAIRKMVPQTEVIILTQHESQEMMRQAFHAGARAYVVKSSIARDLVSALESIHHRELCNKQDSSPERTLSQIDPNEILRRGAALEQELRDSEERYRALVMASSRSVWRCDAEGKNIEHSEKWTQLDDSESDLGEGEDWLQRIHPEDRQRVLQQWQHSLRTGQPYFQESRRRSKDGSYRHQETRAVPIRKADGTVREWIGASVDITRRKRTEAELRASQERIALAHSAAGIGTWQYDPEDGSYNWSAETFSILGIDPSDPNYSQRWLSRIDAQDLPNVMAVLKGGIEHGSVEVEYRYHHPDGGQRWILSKGRTLSLASGESCMFGVSVDITRRKQVEEELRSAHAELEKRVQERTRELILAMAELQAEIQVRSQTEGVMRELSARLLRMQDEERRRIARELHDSTGQTLTALKMNLAALQPSVQKTSPQAAQTLSDTESLADQALREIRTTSYLLHPPLLDESGFSSAARWFVDGLTARSQLRVNLEIAPELGRLPADIELTLFRVLQECLTNILRHSGSEVADVKVDRLPDRVMLNVRDYGRGIPSSALQRRRTGAGVGLAGMRERVSEHGGEIRISSDEGTLVSVSLPVAAAGHAQEETRAGASF